MLDFIATGLTRQAQSSSLPAKALLLASLLVLPAIPALSEVEAAPSTDALDRSKAHYQFALGKLLADAGEFEDALRAFEQSTELDTSDPYNFLEAAKFYGYLAQVSRTKQQQGRYLDQSLELLAKARNLAKDNPDVLRLFAETHLRLGEQRPSSYAVAQGAFERLREIDPSDLRTLTSLGQLYLFARDAEKAADALGDAARYSPRNRMIQSMLVDALLTADRKDEAESALKDLIPLEPANPDHRLKLAELRSERGDHAGAVEALEDSPDGDWLTSQRLRQTLAREYHLAGRDEDALKLIDEILEDPFSRSAPTSGVQRLKAAVLSSLLRYQDAIDVFAPIVEESDEAQRRVQDSLLLSRLHERMGDFSGGMDALRRQLPAVEDRELRGQLRLAIGTVAQRARVYEVAEEEFRDVIDLNQSPEQVAAASQSLAEVLDARGREKEGDRILREAIASSRESIENGPQLEATLRLSLATRFANNQAWPSMRQVGEELSSSPEPSIQFVGLQIQADALAGQGDLDGALNLLDTLKPETRQLTAKRVQLLFEGERPEEAQKIVDSLAQTDVDGKFFAARLLQRHELHEKAAGLLLEVDKEQAESVTVLFALGAAYERSQQLGEAEGTFTKLLELSPDYAPALNYLAYMWTEKGKNLDQALEMIRRAVSDDPDNGAYVDSLGWAYFQLKRYSEAQPHLEWAAGLTPDDPTVFEHLGDLYVAMGKVDDARIVYARALELGEDNEGVIQGKLDTLVGTQGTGAQSPQSSSGESSIEESASSADSR